MDEDNGTSTIYTSTELNNSFRDVEEDQNPSSLTLLSQSNSSVVNCNLGSGIVCTTSANQSGSNTLTVEMNDSSNSAVRVLITVTLSDANDSPYVDLDKPDDGATNSTSNVIDFTFTPSDPDSTIDNCTLIINNVTNITSTSITSGSINNITINLPNANYDWSVNCTDSGNLVGASVARSLTVSKSADEDEDEDEDEDSQGDSISGGLYVDIENSIEDIPLQTDDRFSVVVGDVEQTVLVTDLTPDKVTFQIDPSGIIVIVDKGSSKQVDIDGDGIYDLEITVSDIDSERKTATVSVKQISTPVAQPPEEAPTQEMPGEETPAGQVVYTPSAVNFIKNNFFTLAIAFLIVVLVTFLVVRKLYFKNLKIRTRKR